MPVHHSARSHDFQTTENQSDFELKNKSEYDAHEDGNNDPSVRTSSKDQPPSASATLSHNTNNYNNNNNNNDKSAMSNNSSGSTSIMTPLPQCSIDRHSNQLATCNKNNSNINLETTNGDNSNEGPAEATEAALKNNGKNAESDVQSDNMSHQNNHKGDNSRQQTLNQIVNYLKDFEVNDDLDEDEIIPAITKMNKRSKFRRRHKRWLMRDNSKGDTIDHVESDTEEYWNDNDITQPNNKEQKSDFDQSYLNSMINVVDDHFFADTIENIEESSTFLLNENVLQNLRQSLAMKGKGIMRKRRAVMVVVNDNDDTSDSSDAAVGSIEDGNGVKNRRRTRRMIQESKEKQKQKSCNEEPNGLEDLVGAMIEIEEEEGRSINVDFDECIHLARKLRVRKKDQPKESSRKRELLSPSSQADSDTVPIKKKKKKSMNNNGIKTPQSKATLSPTKRKERTPKKNKDEEDCEYDNDALYAVLPDDHGMIKSARRTIEQRLMRVNSVIVEGKHIDSKDDDGKNEEGEFDSDGNQKKSKRPYKKRGPYGKRGPYKKRKKNENGELSELIIDKMEVNKGSLTPSPPRHSKRNDNDNETESDDESTEIIFAPEESGPISLSLLDWRRRQDQKWAPQKPSKIDHAYLSLLNDEHYHPGIEASIFSLDMINQNTELESSTDQLPTMEPPRKRSSNHLYGCWCSQLLHCLQGGGRLFARHEFFYSDIDKAWYNENLFEKALAKFGIPADSKLTRAEWSMVRRKIQRRPRLFSKAFITSQINKLEEYRETVRQIQQGHGANVLAEKKDFNYEVLAPPKIGAVVTAYNKSAKMIHRGTVLAHHRKMNFFLIQFERKELSWDWVRDTDVASHGLPEVLLPQMEDSDEVRVGTPTARNARNLGSINSGTRFGPLIDFYKREFELSAKKTNTKQLLSQLKKGNDLNVALDHDKQAILAVAEREALAKIMNIIESNLERKRAILDTINEFHKMEDISLTMNETVKNHYVWLHQNLNITDHALESALVHQQILYSKIYTGISMVPNNQIQHNSRRSSNEGDKINDFVIQKTAKEIADELISNIFAPLNISGENTTHSARTSLLSNRVSSATGVMLVNDLFEKNEPLLRSNASEIITKEISRLSSMNIPKLPYELTNIVQARDAAIMDLKESFKMLESELYNGYNSQKVN